MAYLLCNIRNVRVSNNMTQRQADNMARLMNSMHGQTLVRVIPVAGPVPGGREH